LRCRHFARRRLARDVTALLVIPSRFVVAVRGRVKAGEQPVLGKLETLLDDEGRIRVIQEIVLSDAVVFSGVMDEPAQERDIRAHANLTKQVGDRRRTREARIDNNQPSVSGSLGFDDPLETAGMVFRRIAAHDQHHVAIFYVNPTVGHRAPSKRWSQT